MEEVGLWGWGALKKQKLLVSTFVETPAPPPLRTASEHEPWDKHAACCVALHLTALSVESDFLHGLHLSLDFGSPMHHNELYLEHEYQIV